MNLVNCKNTIIGNAEIKGISGGEQRRLSFASEVIFVINSSLFYYCNDQIMVKDNYGSFYFVL
jgi:hypothetical protein